MRFPCSIFASLLSIILTESPIIVVLSNSKAGAIMIMELNVTGLVFWSLVQRRLEQETLLLMLRLDLKKSNTGLKRCKFELVTSNRKVNLTDFHN